MGGLLSFLGGTAFRWLFGEIIGFFKARQEHAQELERMRLEHEQARDRQQWQREAVQAAAQAGIRLVEAQSEAARGAAADAAFLAAVQSVGAVSEEAGTVSERPGFVGWLAGLAVALNAFIRPELAQVSILLIAGSAIWPQHVVLTGLVGEVVCGALGLFVGERIRQRGA